MSDQLFSAEVLEKAVMPPPAREDWYMVVGYWSPGGWWSLHSGRWATEEAARNAAKSLPKGWTHYEIVRIPGHAD